MQDTAQLWRLGNLWAITEVMQGKQFRVIHIVAMAGEYSQSLVTEIENWAVLNGCKKSYFTGRKGWQKRVLDYKLDSITMSKEL